MPKYVTPGVHVSSVPTGARSIESVETSVTAFVGTPASGSGGSVEFVTSFGEYTAAFGDVAGPRDALGLAVQAFFANGGRQALVGPLAAGRGSRLPEADAYAAFFRDVLGARREVGILVLPGQSLAPDKSGNVTVDRAIAHCESLGSCMVLVDPPAGRELRSAADVGALGLPSSSYAALYYPWVEIANPAHDPRQPRRSPATVRIAPSSIAAGIWARTDAGHGVWKAPAGTQASVQGASGLEFVVGDAEQNALNPLGVNAIRDVAGAGPVLWGARTLAPAAEAEWRYVTVRRMAIFLEQSVSQGIGWAAFQPNAAPLWSDLRQAVADFLLGHFRAGAFQGAKDSDAYFVRCGLGQTMTQADVDAGRVILEIGFAPLKPAEFVVLRVVQKTAAS